MLFRLWDSTTVQNGVGLLRGSLEKLMIALLSYAVVPMYAVPLYVGRYITAQVARGSFGIMNEERPPMLFRLYVASAVKYVYLEEHDDSPPR